MYIWSRRTENMAVRLKGVVLTIIVSVNANYASLVRSTRCFTASAPYASPRPVSVI